MCWFDGVAVGFGNPLLSMTPEQRDVALKTLWISPPLWGLSSSLIKMSIVTSYLRIWSSDRFKHICYALVVLLSLFGLTLFFGGIFACIPISHSWAPPDPESHDPKYCMDLPTFMFITSTLNTIIDLIVLAIPIPLFLKLQISPKQRAALTAVFTVGVIVCIASIMRLIALRQLRYDEDPSVSGLPLGIWSGVELNLAIICACLPTLRPVLARAFPRLLCYAAGSSPSRRGASTITHDGNGSFRMYKLKSGGEDGKLGDSDVEIRAMRENLVFPRAPEPSYLDRYKNKSYMDLD
ncbi:hypothetical protein F5Y11DRAFT_214288 [Daldinia sp. FL1419]|nr:hypothetical protein F5Y11DRAFT_214288 [Daldinia sp. FL1419]